MMTESHSSKERKACGFGRSTAVYFGKKRWEFGDTNQPVQDGEKQQSVTLPRSPTVRKDLRNRLPCGTRKKAGVTIRERSPLVIEAADTSGCTA